MLTDLLEKTTDFLKQYPRFIAVVTVSVGVVWILGTAGLQAAWYNSTTSDNQTWQHRQKITIQASQVDSTLSDFPVYVDLSDLGSEFFNSVQADGSDIRVTTSNGATEVAREVVSVDTASSTGELHFKAPTISASQDTEFYIYYGNSDVSNYATSSTYGAQNVWSDYEGVWHIGDGTDSTGNGNDLSSTGNVSFADSGGEVGSATNFPGADGDEATTSDDTTLDVSSTFSFSAWANTDVLDSSFRTIAIKDSNYLLQIDSGDDFAFGHNSGSWNLIDAPGFTISTNTWYHVSGTFDDATDAQNLYIDGNNEASGTETSSPSPTSGDFVVGSSQGFEEWDGLIDEVRLRKEELSADWISAEYTNQSTTTDFYSVGTQQTQAGSNVAFGDNPKGDFADTDWDYRQKITIDASEVDSNLSDFPVYVDLADLGSDFFSNTSVTCGDIRVTAGDGLTELPREIVSCDTSAETGELHFKADSISSLSDTDFYIYYSNSEANNYVNDGTYGSENVWPSSQIGMYHFSEGSGTTTSDSLGDLNGSFNGNTSWTNNGLLGNAVELPSGTTNNVEVSSDMQTQITGGSYTLKAWINPNLSSSNQAIIDTGNEGTNPMRFFLPNSNGAFKVQNAGPFAGTGPQSPDGTLTAGSWSQVVAVVEGTQATLYHNGSEVASGTVDALDQNGNNVGIAGPPTSSGTSMNNLDGIIDEVSVYNNTVSADWISAEYTNQNTPTTFYSVDSQQGHAGIFGDDPDGDYADTDWGYREKITIKSSAVDSTLEDFPVYVDLSDLSANFFSNVRSDGGDIRVTEGDGTTELAREVVSVDTASSTGELHFKANSLSPSTDTEFYIYYGNSLAEDYESDAVYGAESVWTNDYTAVYHMNQHPDQDAGTNEILDSTANNNHGTANGSMTSGDSVVGQIGNTLSFDGTDDHISIPDSSDFDSMSSAYSFSVWHSIPTLQDQKTLLAKGNGNDWHQTIEVRPDNAEANFWGGNIANDDWNFQINVASQYSASTWHHTAGTFSSGSSALLFVDGSQIGSDTPDGDVTTNNEDLLIGVQNVSGLQEFWPGSIDEFRLSSVVRSTDWISAEYTNQSTTTDFYFVGSQDAPDGRFGDDPDGDFADTDWQYREKITIDASNIDSTLSDFPVYVDLSDLSSQFFNNVNSDGSDIRVTNATGTELAREVVSVDTASSTGEIHFKADSISSSNDTVFYIYYGNSSASDYVPTDTYGRNAVWNISGNDTIVHHLETAPSGTVGEFIDSGANGYNASDGNANNRYDVGAPTQISGRLGNALSFNQADRGLMTETTSIPETGNNISYSAWLRPIETGESSDSMVFGHTRAASPTTGLSGFRLADNDDLQPELYVDSDVNYGTTHSLTGELSDWQLGHITWDGSTLSLYVNGVLEATSSAAGNNLDLNGDMIWGSVGSGGRDYNGEIDETRAYLSQTLSADWISAEYANQDSPSTFYTVGTQEADTSIFGDDPDGDFADTDWEYREKITVDADNIDSTLEDFPVYVDLSDLSSQFFNNVNSDGGDIRVTNSAGTELAREVVSVDTGANTGEIHFKADSISASTDTVFYIYYGNSSASDYVPTDTYGRNAVWSDFAAVYHMGTATDSSGNGHSLTTNNGATIGNATSTQQIGEATVFDKSSNQYLSTGFFPDNTVRGISYWANFEANSLSDLDLSGVHDGGSNQRLYLGTGDSQNNEVGSGYGGRWYEPRNDNLTADTPVLLAMDVADAAPSQEVHVNGDNNHNSDETNGGSTTFSGTSDQEFLIGAREEPGGPNNYIDGTIDEFRLHTKAFSHDYRVAEHINQSTTTDFYTVGSQEADTSIFGDDPDGDFADTDWGYREKITVDADNIDSTLEDFPVYVDLSDLSSQFFNNVNSDGSDIRVTTGDGTTELAREVVSVDTGSESGELHFKAGTLHAFSDTSFYIYYGNSSASNYVASDTYGAENVWTNGQIGVWHKNEDPSGVAPQILDSTSNVNHGTSSGSMTSADLVSGKVGQAIDYDGTDDFIQIDNPTGLPTGDFTYSAWLYADDDFSEILFMVPDAFGQNEMIVRNNSGLLQTYIDGNLYSFSEADPDTGVWSKLVISREGGTLSAYLDGSLATTSSVTSATLDFSSCPLFLGADSDTECIDGTMGNYQTGIMDEMQIYNRAVSSDWVSAEYVNQSTTTDFYTVGTQEASVIETPSLTAPADESVDVARNPTLDWSDLSGASEYQVQVSTNSGFYSTDVDETTNTSTIDLGPPYPVLAENQTYYWRVRGVDGEETGDWSSASEFTTASGMAGAGTEADPYLITSPQELDEMRDDLDAYYELANDIDMEFATQDPAGDFWNSGSGWDPVKQFDGELDMNGYSIIGLEVLESDFDRGLGLLSQTGPNTYIHDGKFVDSRQVDGSDAGHVIGRGEGTIERVAVVNSTIEGDDGSRQGQLIGRPSGDSFAMRDSYVVGGQMPGGISNGGASGRLMMNSSNSPAIFERNFSATQISPDTTSNSTGGVIGWNGDADLQGSANFYDGDVMNQAVERHSSIVTELTTSGAKDFDTYNNAGWDIVLKENHDGQQETATWFIDDGEDYPKLWFEWEAGADNTTFGDDPDGNWADTDWDHREKITIDSSRVDEPLTDFPVYLDLSDLSTQFFANVQSNGGDIRLTNASGTELAREVVSLETGSTAGELHFKADSIASSTDTDFYIYYGNSEAEAYATDDTYGRNAVWSDYEAVWHLSEDPSGSAPQFADSTGNGYDGTESNMDASNSVNGQTGTAVDFNGSDEEITLASPIVISRDAHSVFYWINSDVNDAHTLMGATTSSNYMIPRTDQDGVYVNANAVGEDFLSYNTDVVTGEWNSYVTLFKGSTADQYVNGSAGEIGETLNDGDFTIDRIGRFDTNFQYAMDGSIDELRIGNFVATADRISAEHTNQNTPTAFYSIGGDETVSDDTTAPTPDPMTFASAPDGASTTAVTMSATEADDAAGSEPIEYFFDPQSCTGSDSGNSGSGGSDSGWQTSLNYTDTGLEANHCYGYRVKARDSAGNETSYSSSSQAYTVAAVPDAPSVSEPTQTTLTLSNDENGNPLTAPTTTFAVQISVTDPNDGTWDGQYVDSSGSATSTTTWLTDAQIDDLVLGSLQVDTTYTFRVKARNEDGEETAWSPTYDGVTREETTTETSSQLRGGSTIRGGGIIR